MGKVLVLCALMAGCDPTWIELPRPCAEAVECDDADPCTFDLCDVARPCAHDDCPADSGPLVCWNLPLDADCDGHATAAGECADLGAPWDDVDDNDSTRW